MFSLVTLTSSSFRVRHAGEIHAWPDTHQELPGRIHIAFIRQLVGS